MVKVLRSFVNGPLEPHIAGFAEEFFDSVDHSLMVKVLNDGLGDDLAGVQRRFRWRW